MKLNLLFLVAVVAAASCVVEAVSVPDGIEKDAHFEAFMDFTHQFEKKYATVEEFLVRMDNFKASMRRVAHLQALAGNVTQFGITQFSDMTPQEFSDRVLNPRMTDFLGDISNITVVPRPHNFAAPTSFDWRTVPNVLSAVKNQGSCGSCWAFAAVEQLESMWYRRKSPSAPIVLSPQQLVSCSINNSGCNGGMAMRAWEWIKSKGGIVGESTYPYKSGTTKVSGTCAVASPNIATVWSGGTPWAFIQNPCTTDCPNVNVSPMKEYLAAQGPIQVNVCADAFQDYVSGVLQSNVCASSFSKMNHAVQAVGYNAAASPPYWIIRNSWSAVWAIKGYMYISMQNNACGVANLPATVFINGVNN